MPAVDHYLCTLFRMNTNTSEQALDLESKGKWNRAAGIYEQILQCNPNDLEVHEKYLKCLLRLGHFSAIIAHVNGVQHIDDTQDDGDDVTIRNQLKPLQTLTNMTNNDLSTNIVPPSPIPAVSNRQDSLQSMDDVEAYSNHFNLQQNGKNNEHKDVGESNDFVEKLVSFGIESAWKLQRWELLDEFLSKCPESKLQNSFPCRLGQCMSILRASRGFREMDLTEKFERAVDSARVIVMKDISSCHLEGYQIVYPHLVRLHMLQELTHFQMSCTIGAHGKLDIAIFPNRAESGNLFGNKQVITTTDQSVITEYMNRNNSFFWNHRLNRTSNMLAVREPILSLRRVLYSLQHLKQEEAFCWLALAKEARAHQQLSHANTALVYAEMISQRLAVPFIKWQAFLEKIQLTYNQGEIHQSLMKTQKVLSNEDSREIPSGISSEMNVLLAGWMNETNSYESQEIISRYKTALRLESREEEPYFKLATYCDELFNRNFHSAAQTRTKSGEQQWKEWSKMGNEKKLVLCANGQEVPVLVAMQRKYNLVAMLHEMLYNYSTSLMFGHKHLFRSLPRLFTLWCENGTVLSKLSSLKYGDPLTLSNRSGSSSSHSSSRSSRSSSNRSALSNMHRKALDNMNWGRNKYPLYVEEWAKALPEYQFMCILPIITARITYESHHIVKFINIVLTRCLAKYPPQLLWHIALLINYNHLDSTKSNHRRQCGAKVVEYLKHYLSKLDDRLRGSTISQLMEQMTNVLGSLIKLVPPKPDSRASNGSRRSSVKRVKFPSYLSNPRLTDGFLIVVPTQMNLGV